MKTTNFLLLIFVLIGFFISTESKRLFYDNDNDMELSDKKARMFLRAIFDDNNDESSVLDTRELSNGKNCVKCKFGINPCCAPNICVKKRFRPDECMEIKTGRK